MPLPKVKRTYSSVNILGVKTLYLVSFLVIAASPFYCIGYLYCISFFYIIIDNDILQRALQSVTKNCEKMRIVIAVARSECVQYVCRFTLPFYLSLFFREVTAVGGHTAADYCLDLCYHHLCSF